MENFIYDIPTKIYFGKNQIQQLRNIVNQYGKRILLVYGKGSIYKNGLYEDILTQCQDLFIVEHSGIGANPTIDFVRKGIDLCNQNQIEIVLAVGGGSVIDCAKMIAAGVYYPGDPWDLVKNPEKIQYALPVITVLTIAATGSEMDHIAVISNLETQEKIGTRHPVLRPKASILDPTYTFTVSKKQTASGIADILSHAMESYFSKEEGYFQDQVAKAIMKTIIHFGKQAIENPEDYTARANIMWASSWAINDFIKLGKMVAWSVHPIEHQLSAVYDITHGIGLAILTPHWMEHILSEETVNRFVDLAVDVWQVKEEQDPFETAKKGIEQLKQFYQSIGLHETLRDLGIKNDEHFLEMAQKASPQLENAYVPLSVNEIIEIYKKSL
ncbi:MAG: iron-containing alcohol dehydrogenase [Floccifex sp.]